MGTTAQGRQARDEMTRRHCLASMTRRHISRRAGMLAAGLRACGRAMRRPIRQGYQTNMWGMPTYYLLKSGLLEKRGIKFEEFAVPSGNLTMQQMVARQVDLGTYAGPSFIHRPRQGRPRRHRRDRACRQDRADRGAQGPRHHQGRAAPGSQGRQPDRLIDRQHLRRRRSRATPASRKATTRKCA